MTQFEEIHQYAPILLGIGGMIFFLLLTVAAATNLYGSKKSVWIKYVLPWGTGALLIAVCLVYMLNAQEANNQAFKNNVKQKYDIDEAYIEFRGKYTTPTKTDVQSVYVQMDGSIYEFYVTQDKNTWEPTLVHAPMKHSTVKQWEQVEPPKR